MCAEYGHSDVSEWTMRVINVGVVGLLMAPMWLVVYLYTAELYPTPVSPTVSLYLIQKQTQ